MKKFLDKKVDGLSGDVEHIYYQVNEDNSPTSMEVVATLKGIQFRGRGEPISDPTELSHLAYVISEAWKKHKKFREGLAKKLTLT